MSVVALPLERLEAELEKLNGRKVIVRVAIFGGIQLNFFGSIISQMDSDDEPQFIVVYDKAPGCTLLFRTKDVNNVVFLKDAYGSEIPNIWLKRLVDIAHEMT